MDEPVGIHLELSSHAGNVAVVRAAVGAVAEQLGFNAELTADLKTAVSEACNNVSLHAYPDGEVGPMVVDLVCDATGVEATVTDQGRGISRIIADEHRMGLGLAVINALSDRSQFQTPSGGGAQVGMFFEHALPTVSATPAHGPAAPLPQVFGHDDAAVVLWCTRPDVQRLVLARVLWYMAATAHFSVDGISFVNAAARAVADHVQRTASGEWAGARITSQPRSLCLSVGPLAHATVAQDLLDSVEWLGTEPLDGVELLEVTIADRGRPSPADA